MRKYSPDSCTRDTKSGTWGSRAGPGGMPPKDPSRLTTGRLSDIPRPNHPESRSEMLTLFRTMTIAALMCAAAFAHDISGKWTFNVETSAGSGTPTFVFKQAGEKLTGTYNGTFGTAELTGTVKGDAIEFSFEASVGDQKGKVTYKGKI